MNKALLFSIMLLGTFASAAAEVSSGQLENALGSPQNWLMYSGDYSGKRYSGLTQVNTGNVTHLVPAWTFQSQVEGTFEGTPLVVDGVMYVTGPDNHGYALDGRTGRVIWRYDRPLPSNIPVCCGRVNRGFAALGGKLFMATLDGHVVALDARTGSVLWDVKSADYQRGYAFTLAPLVVKDKVVVGISGGEYGVRGFIDAYDANSGKRVWRFYTVPGPGEPGNETWAGDSWRRGGAPAWITGTYDPELNLIYWTTGNPAPSNNPTVRKGDNLYSNSVVALEADSGRLRWHF